MPINKLKFEFSAEGEARRGCPSSSGSLRGSPPNIQTREPLGTKPKQQQGLCFPFCDKWSQVFPCAWALCIVSSHTDTFRLETGCHTTCFLIHCKGGKHIDGILVKFVMFVCIFSTTRGGQEMFRVTFSNPADKRPLSHKECMFLLLLCVCVCVLYPVLTANTSAVLHWLHSVFMMFPLEKFSAPKLWVNIKQTTWETFLCVRLYNSTSKLARTCLWGRCVPCGMSHKVLVPGLPISTKSHIVAQSCVRGSVLLTHPQLNGHLSLYRQEWSWCVVHSFSL